MLRAWSSAAIPRTKLWFLHSGSVSDLGSSINIVSVLPQVDPLAFVGEVVAQVILLVKQIEKRSDSSNSSTSKIQRTKEIIIIVFNDRVSRRIAVDPELSACLLASKIPCDDNIV